MVAGVMKGIIGVGMPIVALPLLSMLIDVRAAVMLLSMPLILSNIPQAIEGGETVACFMRLIPVLLGMMPGWALRSEMLEKTLDALVAGVFLTARDGRVVYMNAAAERQIRTGNSIRIVNNRIFPTDPAARAALSKAIDEASRDDIDKDMSEHSLAIPGVDGAGYVATLLPVDRGERRGIVAPFAASVAVFTQDPVLSPLMPGEAFARLYKLTGGELRVLLALAQGLGAKEAADMLGISEPTVRSHLQHIFSKTETPRQADLLRLLHNSTPPIRALQPAH
jgi:DNA-binding CsgD family transcriptional regulator/PAS domain-containing protein